MLINSGKTKQCSCCKEVKNVEDFHKCLKMKDGLFSICKKCNINRASKYISEKRRNDLNYNKRNRTKDRIKRKLKTPFGKKSKFILNTVGISLDEFKKYLQESANYSDFNIENYDGNKYHIHHLKDWHDFNFCNELELKDYFYYKNCVILSKEDHLKVHKEINANVK